MATISDPFSIRQAKALVKDLSRPNPRIYWVDFLSSITLGHICLAILNRLVRQGVAEFSATHWLMAVLLFSITAVSYMRSVMFIHELVHLPEQSFKSFRVAWNLLCGIPLLVPSFLYYPHIDHHRRKHYGTSLDGEYLDLSHRHPSNILLFVAAAFVVPPVAFLRFALLTPLGWFVPSFRNWIERHASSMIIDIFYVRGDFGAQARRIMRWQEALCFAWCCGLIGLWSIERITSTSIATSYLLAVVLIGLNNIRTLGAHRWIGDGRELTFEEQLLDSVNYPHRWWVTELWGPVGTRFHALHHLFPSLPYHNMPEAHRRLMAGLPSDSIYRQTERTSLVRAIAELWLRAESREENRYRTTGKEAFHHSGSSSSEMPSDRSQQAA